MSWKGKPGESVLLLHSLDEEDDEEHTETQYRERCTTSRREMTESNNRPLGRSRAECPRCSNDLLNTHSFCLCPGAFAHGWLIVSMHLHEKHSKQVQMRMCLVCGFNQMKVRFL